MADTRSARYLFAKVLEPPELFISSHRESRIISLSQNSVLIAATWYDNPHENSALIQDKVLYLAIGNQVCKLSLPDLNLIWYQDSLWNRK